jgi:hypothetical protein
VRGPIRRRLDKKRSGWTSSFGSSRDGRAFAATDTAGGRCVRLIALFCSWTVSVLLDLMPKLSTPGGHVGCHMRACHLWPRLGLVEMDLQLPAS